jgi:stage II sporulation protein D
VRIFSATVVSSVSFKPSSGEYEVWGDTLKLFDAGINSVVQFSYEENHIKVKKFDADLGKYRLIKIIQKNSFSSFRLKPVIPSLAVRNYPDNLIISVSDKLLQLLNEVDLENYIPGVVEAEVGSGNPAEFNKAKSIICRTYALSNLRRHETEGFHLCDQVHCQVYRKKSEAPDLISAVKETEGMILVDSSAQPINAAFHSNCGGQTANSEDVWLTALPYLRSVNDTFCTRQPNAVWIKKIPRHDWVNYFLTRYKISFHDSVNTKTALNFSQPYRKSSISFDSASVPLKNIRIDFNLKSSFFSVEPADGSVILHGRGFGHGVGLCQEGAMAIARKGQSYKNILYYYYTNIHILNLSELDFFHE